MNEDFQRAKLQGTLGALCLLVASIAYSKKAKSRTWILKS